MNLTVKFCNLYIKDAGNIVLYSSRQNIDIIWDGVEQKYYTVELKNIKTNEIHMFIINLPGDNNILESGYTVSPPKPILRSGYYRVILYSQTQWLPEVVESKYRGLYQLESISFYVDVRIKNNTILNDMLSKY